MNKPNSIQNLFDMYKEGARKEWLAEDAETLERNAFCAGIVAAFMIVDEDMINYDNEKTGRSVEDELDELVTTRLEAN